MFLLCKWCSETKQEDEFLKRNRDLPYSQSNVRCCKKCNAENNRARYRRSDVREKQKRLNERWRKSNTSKMREYSRKHHEKFPERKSSHFRVKHLLRSGYWTRQPCCICGATEKVEAHHDSYAEPHWETVRWLCKQHHEDWHVILDPHRNSIVEEPLAEVERLRSEAKSVMEQVNVLREKYRSLTEQAQMLEIECWTRVLVTAHPLFEEFSRSGGRPPSVSGLEPTTRMRPA